MPDPSPVNNGGFDQMHLPAWRHPPGTAVAISGSEQELRGPENE